MTRQFENELVAAKNVNERAAAYAGEVIRLQCVNADLLAALQSIQRQVFTMLDDPDELTAESLAFRLSRVFETCGGAIAKATGG
jgi:hypothetical protein